ncbi:histidinol-phosphatase [Patescibacteria group bacterium]|nr:histidinol-phosphatase [Patescibacteria group bacterium]
MIFDFHSHTRQQDGENSAREMVEAAIAKGLKIYGISEHSPRLPTFRYHDDPPNEVRGARGWDEFLAEIEKLQKEFARKIEVLKGCEIDWLGEENIPWTKDLIQKGNFDYTIGSVHFLGKWGFDYEKDWKMGFSNFKNVGEIYQKYFLEYSKMVSSNLFDIAGHLDLIKKFNDEYPLPKNSKILELAKPALDALADSKMILEISSAGLRKPCRDWYPSEELLAAAFERKIPITLNSDAHSTDRIAENFEAAKELAKKVGYEKAVVFHAKREREFVEI